MNSTCVQAYDPGRFETSCQTCWKYRLFKMIVGVLTTCYTQYTWDRYIRIFLFNRTTLYVFVTYLTSALYVHPLWFYKHQHEYRVRSKLSVACQPFAAILVNCAPSGEMHNYCTPHIIKENFENFLIHRCTYIPLSQVYCVWHVVKIPTIILNSPVLKAPRHCGFFSSTFWVHQYQTHFHVHMLKGYPNICYLWNKRLLQWDQVILLKIQHSWLSADVLFAPLLYPAKVRTSNLDHIQYSTGQCTGNAQSSLYIVPNIH